MKMNSHYAGDRPRPAFGPAENGLREDQVRVEGADMIRLDDDILRAYAAHFGRFIDSYAELGIPVRMVMPQNEFNSAQSFPSCTWTPEGLVRFIRHLAPEMLRRVVDLFLGTLERADDGHTGHSRFRPDQDPGWPDYGNIRAVMVLDAESEVVAAVRVRENSDRIVRGLAAAAS